MTLGFFYHINIFIDAHGCVYTSRPIGVFVDELAKNVDKLYYWAYTTTTHNKSEQSYQLQNKNIEVVNIGKKPKFPVLVYFGGRYLSKYKSTASRCDAILVRAPSPIAPHFYSQYKSLTNIHYLMVGDYLEGIKHQDFNFIKQTLINIYTLRYEKMQDKAISNCVIFVNSSLLREKYEPFAKQVIDIKTTTLSKNDFYYRKDTCLKNDIHLLCVGRIEKPKGVEEVYEAFKLLSTSNLQYDFHLHFVGWETKDSERYKQLFLSDATKYNKVHNIHFDGFKSGNDLLQAYRNADIYIIDSHHEGFPRTIWEAMANSTPVIASKVGSIPNTIDHLQNGYLINSKSHIQLYDAVLKIISDTTLRQFMIKNAFDLVQGVRLDVQTEKIITEIKNVE